MILILVIVGQIKSSMSRISQHLPLYCFFWSKHVDSIKQHFQRKFCFHKEEVFAVKHSVITFSEEKIFYLFARNTFSFWNVTLFIEEKKRLIFSRFLCHENGKYLNIYQEKKKRYLKIFCQSRSRLSWNCRGAECGEPWQCLTLPCGNQSGHQRRLLGSTWIGCWHSHRLPRPCRHMMWLLGTGTGTSTLPWTLLEVLPPFLSRRCWCSAEPRIPRSSSHPPNLGTGKPQWQLWGWTGTCPARTELDVASRATGH